MQTTEKAPSLVTNRLQPSVGTVTVLTTESAPILTPTQLSLTMVVLLLVGVGLRAVALFSDRSLWLDEAMLALNLVNRTPAQLLAPLDYNQGAPVGFLLAVKGAISAFGTSEWALRLVPFLASLAGLASFAWITRRLLPPQAALLAVALLALSPYLVSYAAECKQYASDAAIAVGLLAVALGLLEGRGGFARWALLAGVGAAAVWCSHPATFVLGGIGTALLLYAARERDLNRFLAAGLTIACWLVSFGVCYFLCLKQLGNNKYLTDYWTDHFMPLPPKSVGDLAWLADHFVAVFSVPGGFGGSMIPLGGLAAALALIGLRELARERWPVVVALSTTAALLLLASGLHKYPVGGRLLLFLVPLATLVVANGAWTVFDALREKNRFAAFVLLGLVVAGGAWPTLDVLRRPMRAEPLRPVLEDLRAEIQPGDRVYVYYSGVPAFIFYTREQPFPAEVVTLGQDHQDDPAALRAELAQLHGRVWVIFSHPHNQEEMRLLATLDCRGTCERQLKRSQAAARLYRLE